LVDVGKGKDRGRDNGEVVNTLSALWLMGLLSSVVLIEI